MITAEPLEDIQQEEQPKVVDTYYVEDNKQDTVTGEFTDEHEAKNFIKQAMTYVKSESFSNKCDELAEKYKISKKKVAKTFFQKVLGQIGDKSKLAFDTFETGVMMFVNIISFILKKAIDIVFTLARLLFKAFTFNYTCSSVNTAKI